MSGVYLGVWTLIFILESEFPQLTCFMVLDTVVFFMQIIFYYFSLQQQRNLDTALELIEDNFMSLQIIDRIYKTRKRMLKHKADVQAIEDEVEEILDEHFKQDEME